jgi:hypothetical protein
LDS